MKTWFRSIDDNRLRAGWRILLFLVLLVVVAAPAQLAVRALLGGLHAGGPLSLTIIASAATLAVFLARRFMDRKSFVSLGLANIGTGWKDILFGFALSGAMAGAVFSTMLLLGIIDNVELHWAGWSSLALLLSLLLPTILIGFWEELVFRGYLLQNMAEGMGPRLAVIVSCLLYGLVHSANPNATLLSSMIIVLFGYLRIYGLLSTGLLWLSMGMHIGWNFFQGPVFGFAASGHAEEATLFAHRAVAADWLSGGNFGPEGSVLVIPALLLALLTMRAWSRRSDAVHHPQVALV